LRKVAVKATINKTVRISFSYSLEKLDQWQRPLPLFHHVMRNISWLEIIFSRQI